MLLDILRGVPLAIVALAVLYPGTPNDLRIAGGMILACGALVVLITRAVNKVRDRNTHNTDT
jgi:hypothetical protein